MAGQQPPRRPPPPGYRGMSEFADVLGDEQRPGGGRPVQALVYDPMMPRRAPTPGSPAARAAASAAGTLQVQSVFDARQIGSFDFVTTFTTDATGDPPIKTNSFEVPQGYTLIVRRIEFSMFPALSGSDTKTFIAVTPLYDGNALTFNRAEFWGVIESGGWDTYHVCEQGHTFGVVWEAGPTDVFDIGFRFFGNLIQTLGRPAVTEPGTLPLQVKLGG